MDRPDHPGLCIGQQYWRAVGGQDGADHAGRCAGHRVALGPETLPAGLGHPGDGGMDLVAAGQIIGRAPHPLGRAAAVLGHGSRVIP